MVRINWAGQTGKKTRYNGESKIVLSPTFRIENLDLIKGQLISKYHFGVIVLTTITTKIL